jgi:hypothetical protein
MFLDWRIQSRKGDSPFQLGPRQRSLRLFYDRETFAPGMATVLLDELQSAPDLEVETTMLDGHLCVEFTELQGDGLSVVFRGRDRYSETLVQNLSTWSHFAHERFKGDGHLPDGRWKDPEYRLRRLLLMRLANQHWADLFVTDDRFLLEVSDIEFTGTNVVSTREGVAILGAHLRNRHISTYRSSADGRFISYLTGNSFYRGCRRAILNSTTIMSARFDDETMKHSVQQAFAAIVIRTEQLLRVRDNAIFALLQPHDHDVFDDALFALDAFVLVLGSIFDSLAQMVDAVLAPKSTAQHPDWKSDRWMKALRNKDSEFARLVAPGTRYFYLLELHGYLRNMIHGAIHKQVIFTDNHLPPEGLIIVPEERPKMVHRSIHELGGPVRLGAIDRNGELWLRPGPLIEAFLNDGMSFARAICVGLSERLPAGDSPHAAAEQKLDKIANRCAYLAGITDVSTFRFDDS